MKPRRLRKSWDDYTREARRPPLELELPGGEVIAIEQPNGEASQTISVGLRLNNPAMLAPALFGPKNGARILDLYSSAPGGVFMELVTDIFAEFNLSTNDAEEQVGDSGASPA